MPPPPHSLGNNDRTGSFGAAEVPRDFYAEVPFDLEIEGSYHDLARFFEMVAALPRIVNIGALDIDVASENQTATRLKVSGKAKTYRFLSDEA